VEEEGGLRWNAYFDMHDFLIYKAPGGAGGASCENGDRVKERYDVRLPEAPLNREVGVRTQRKKRKKNNMFSLEEILSLGIRIEKNGEEFYREAQKKVALEELKILLNRLADDEVEHAGFFTRKKEALKSKPEDPELEKMASSILQGILGDQTFSLKEADPGDIKTIDDLLNLAIGFEKDTILFYEMLTALVARDDTLKGIQEIIEEENRHVAMLQGFKEGRSVKDAL
jgi:rubrerythrin